MESTLSKIINKNPDRAYDINFEDLDLHALLKGVTLESATITPINVSDSSTDINGTVDHIELAGVKWGPFNFMWESAKEGLLFIVPTGASSILLGDVEKKAEKAQEENEAKQSKERQEET